MTRHQHRNSIRRQSVVSSSYVLAHQADFNGAELQRAVEETFGHRNTGLNDIVAFEPGFTEDPLRRSRWNAFVKKKKAMLQVTLDETIDIHNSHVIFQN